MVDCSTQDNLIEYADKFVSTIENPSKSTQTIKISKWVDKNVIEKIRIAPEIIETIEEVLEQCRLEDEYFYELDELRRDEKLELSWFRTAKIPISDKLPVVGLVGGFNLKVAVLFGEPRHDSWCQHANSGRVFIYNKLRFLSSIYLPSCPTKAVFAPQNQLIIATASGELLLCFESEIIWRSTTIHSHCISCLHWISPNLLLTACLNGQIVISTLKSNQLEVTKSTIVHSNNLPRVLRRTANMQNTKQKVGIIDLTENNGEIYIASETGAIWSLNLKELSLHQCGFELNRIENFAFLPQNTMEEDEREYFIIQTPLGELRKKLKNEFVNSKLLWQIQNTQKAFCLKKKSSLILSLTEEGETIGYDLASNQIVMTNEAGETPNFMAIALCDDDSVLIGLTNDYQIYFYNFSIDL